MSNQLRAIGSLTVLALTLGGCSGGAGTSGSAFLPTTTSGAASNAISQTRSLDGSKTAKSDDGDHGPSNGPTDAPHQSPSPHPSDRPDPSKSPAASPTPCQSGSPSGRPTQKPTAAPTVTPTAAPTAVPTATPTPAATPTNVATGGSGNTFVSPITMTTGTLNIDAFGKSDIRISEFGSPVTITGFPNPQIATVVQTGSGAFSIVTGDVAGTTSVVFFDGQRSLKYVICATGKAPRIVPHVLGLTNGLAHLGLSLLSVAPTAPGTLCPSHFSVTSPIVALVKSVTELAPVAVPTGSGSCGSAFRYLIPTSVAGSAYVAISDSVSTSYVGFTAGQ